MKTLDELGISPAPWNVIPYNHSMIDDTPILGDVESADGESIIDEQYTLTTYSDARLIAAAPELYEALRTILDVLDGYGFKPMVKGDPLEVAVKCGQEAIKKAGGVE